MNQLTITILGLIIICYIILIVLLCVLHWPDILKDYRRNRDHIKGITIGNILLTTLVLPSFLISVIVYLIIIGIKKLWHSDLFDSFLLHVWNKKIFK